MRTNRWAAMLLVALMPILAACGDAPDPGTTGDDIPVPATSRDTAPADATTPDPAAREDSLRAALRSLLAGPTPEQRAAGAHSWFSDTTAHALREVEVDGGRVVVDLDGDLHELIPNASTSAGSAILLADLDSVVFSFPWVEEAEYRMGGSCDAFWEWLQRGCGTVTR